MTPSRWLFFPTQPSLTSAQVQFTGNLARTLSGRTRSGISNWAASGPDANAYFAYVFAPLRLLSTSIEWIIRLNTFGTYANTGAWNTANSSSLTLTGSSLAIGNAILPATSLTQGLNNPNSTIVRFRFGASPTNLTNFWNSGIAGDAITMNINY